MINFVLECMEILSKFMIGSIFMALGFGFLILLFALIMSIFDWIEKL